MRQRTVQVVGEARLGADAIEAVRREMRGIHGARQAMDVGMEMLARFVEGGATGQDDVCRFQQHTLALQQLRRCELERGQLVHAVVDERAGIEVLDERQRHGRVEPRQRLSEQARGQEVGDERLQRRHLVVVEPRRGHRRERREHLDTFGLANGLQPGHALREDGLLDEEDIELPGQPREQVLRPLEHEAPAQMGKHDQGYPARRARGQERGQGVGRGRMHRRLRQSGWEVARCGKRHSPRDEAHACP